MDEETSDKSDIDSADPYHLHRSDHPDIILVSKPLDENNYGTWIRSMHIPRSAKNKTGFVDGSFKRPSQADAKIFMWRMQ